MGVGCLPLLLGDRLTLELPLEYLLGTFPLATVLLISYLDRFLLLLFLVRLVHFNLVFLGLEDLVCSLVDWDVGEPGVDLTHPTPL